MDLVIYSVCGLASTLDIMWGNFLAARKRNGGNRRGVKSEPGSIPIKLRNKKMGTENKATYHSNNIRTPAGAAICLMRKHILLYNICHSFFFFHFHNTADLHTVQFSPRGNILFFISNAALSCSAVWCTVALSLLPTRTKTLYIHPGWIWNANVINTNTDYWKFDWTWPEISFVATIWSDHIQKLIRMGSCHLVVCCPCDPPLWWCQVWWLW